MNDSEAGVTIARVTSTKRHGRDIKRADLLTIVVEMLLISSVAYGVDGLTGQGQYMALAAMGIAIYVSTHHFRILRSEIRSLRAEIRRQNGPVRRSSQAPAFPVPHGSYARHAEVADRAFHKTQ